MSKNTINPGILNKRIIIQSPPTAKDSYGAPTGDWTDYKTVWASINPIVGKEYFSAETVNNEITHKIRIRYIPGVKPSMRVKYNDRYFEIVGPPINYKEANIELQLMCKELV